MHCWEVVLKPTRARDNPAPICLPELEASWVALETEQRHLQVQNTCAFKGAMSHA